MHQSPGRVPTAPRGVPRARAAKPTAGPLRTCGLLARLLEKYEFLDNAHARRVTRCFSFEAHISKREGEEGEEEEEGRLKGRSPQALVLGADLCLGAAENHAARPRWSHASALERPAAAGGGGPEQPRGGSRSVPRMQGAKSTHMWKSVNSSVKRSLLL